MIDDVQRFLSMDDTSQSVRQGANGDKINSTLKLSVNSTRLAQKQLLLPLVASCSAVMSPKIAWMIPRILKRSRFSRTNGRSW